MVVLSTPNRVPSHAAGTLPAVHRSHCPKGVRSGSHERLHISWGDEMLEGTNIQEHNIPVNAAITGEGWCYLNIVASDIGTAAVHGTPRGPGGRGGGGGGC